MNSTPNAGAFDMRIEAAWRDSALWLTQNYVQIVVAAVVGGIVAAALLGLKWLGKRLAKKHVGTNHWRAIIGAALAKIRLWFIAAVVAQVVARYAHAPGDVGATIQFLFVIAATIQAAIFVREVVLGLVEHRARGHEDNSGLASAMGIIRLLVTIGLFAISALLILSNLGVNVTGLIAGLGVGGIAIGLAAQGIFADLFAALAILFDRPFRKGDAVRYDTTSGTIEDIGLKSTRIRAITGEQIIIANKQLLEKEIHNLARLDRRRIVSTIGVAYHTDPKMLAELPRILGDIVGTCGDARLVRAGLVTFSPSTLDYELQYDVHSEDYDVVFNTRHLVNIAILKRFAELGIELPFPAQVTYTAAPDGTLVMPFPEPLKTEVVERK
jgi:small-conductance mechanosensitive channel